jgi:hypothetical protein
LTIPKRSVKIIIVVSDRKRTRHSISVNAGMAELADAQASGACGSNTVRVQVPLPALSFCPKTGNGKKRPVSIDASYFDHRRMNRRATGARIRVPVAFLLFFNFVILRGKIHEPVL